MRLHYPFVSLNITNKSSPAKGLLIARESKLVQVADVFPSISVKACFVCAVLIFAASQVFSYIFRHKSLTCEDSFLTARDWIASYKTYWFAVNFVSEHDTVRSERTTQLYLDEYFSFACV